MIVKKLTTSSLEMQIHSNYGVGDKELFPANRSL